MKRIVFYLSVVLALLVLLGCFHINTWNTATLIETPHGCDWFGYLRQARLFREQGPMGGLDTAIRDGRTAYLVGVAKSLGVPPEQWNHAVAPHCHNFKVRTDRVILQYPPGTGAVFALFPEGVQMRWAFVAYCLIILAVLALTIVNARSLIVPVLALGLGLVCYLCLFHYQQDFSIPPSVISALLLGYLTAATCAAQTTSARVILSTLLGFVLGLSVSFRIANVLLAAGPFIVFGFAVLRQRSGTAVGSALALAIAFVFGLLPVLAANAINAGSPFATTYGSTDASLPKLDWESLVQGFSFYFVEQQTAAGYVFVGALMTLLALGVGRFAHASAVVEAGAVAAIDLAVNIGYTVTHEPRARYYLIPVAIYATATAAFSIMHYANARAADAGGPRLVLTAKIAALAVTAMLAAIGMRQLSMPVSPNYVRPEVAADIDPNGIVWSDISSGNFVYFLRRQAALLVFLDPQLQDRFVSAIARDGVAQYLVADSDGMDQSIARLARTNNLRRVGKAFGLDVYKLN